MLDNDMTQLVIVLLAAIAAGSVVFALLYPYIAGDMQKEKRLQLVAESKAKRAARNVQAEQTSARRKAVAETLKDLEDQQKSKQKVSLRLRLQRAGLDITTQMFWTMSAVTGVTMAALLYIMMPSVPPIALGVVAFIGAFGLPRWVVNKMTQRRQAKFLNEFANAVDVIVRGVKSGLPLNECLGIIARESPSPLREEFQDLIEQQRVGIPLGECFERMIARVPLAEVKFFSIVIGIQQQAGGNLSEALGNLSGVLRDRKTLAAKVQAMSSEAKASAMVLGSLPFIVSLLVYVTTPGYIAILWSTKTGIFLLCCGAVWMSMGVFMMKKMINFKY